MKASSATKPCSYLNFYSLYNILKDQLYRIRGSEFYKWRFRSEKFTGLSTKGSQIPKPKGYIFCILKKLRFSRNPTPNSHHQERGQSTVGIYFQTDKN